jgi:hypothetical protein
MGHRVNQALECSLARPEPLSDLTLYLTQFPLFPLGQLDRNARMQDLTPIAQLRDLDSEHREHRDKVRINPYHHNQLRFAGGRHARHSRSRHHHIEGIEGVRDRRGQVLQSRTFD